MRRSGLLALTLALPSCSDTTAPLPDLTAIAVVVEVAPATIVAGQPASITLTLRNTKPWAVEISECPIYFTVEDAGGGVVGGSDALMCLARASLIYRPLRFEGLETKTLTFDWPGAQTAGVPAGQYDVFGWVNDPQHASAAAQITITSSN